MPCFSPELCFMCNVLFTGCYVHYMSREGVGWEKWLRPPQIGSKVCPSAPPKVYIRQIFSPPCCNEARALHQKILKHLDLKKWKLCLVSIGVGQNWGAKEKAWQGSARGSVLWRWCFMTPGDCLPKLFEQTEFAWEKKDNKRQQDGKAILGQFDAVIKLLNYT